MNKTTAPTSNTSSLPTPPPSTSTPADTTSAASASNVNGYRLPDNNTLQYGI